MQILCYHLAFIQNALPFPCSLPLPPPKQVLCVSHRELQTPGGYMQSHGVLGMKALFKQLDEIYDMKDIRFYSF
jgi:hypothetical protein